MVCVGTAAQGEQCYDGNQSVNGSEKVLITSRVLISCFSNVSVQTVYPMHQDSFSTNRDGPMNPLAIHLLRVIYNTYDF